MATEPTLRNLWKRRNDLVDDLIDNVKEQLTGDADDEDMEALEAWAEINREIDSRLDRLEELEDRLAEAAGEEVVRRPSLSGRPRIDASDADDELYAAVGAESRRRRPPAASCPECGGKVEPGDRFCGQCGHRLGSADR